MGYRLESKRCFLAFFSSALENRSGFKAFIIFLLSALEGKGTDNRAESVLSNFFIIIIIFA